MVARLILALLLAAFALPAMASAPCHDGAERMPGMSMHHDSPAPTTGHDRPVRDGNAIAVHSCLGCIPPASLIRPGFAAPLRPEGMLRIAPLARFDAGRSTPPATPPPRLEA